jgi:hypothetical protein
MIPGRPRQPARMQRKFTGTADFIPFLTIILHGIYTIKTTAIAGRFC